VLRQVGFALRARLTGTIPVRSTKPSFLVLISRKRVQRLT